MAQHKASLLSIEFTADAAHELLGRQSVRTTFKISSRAIDALSVLAMQMGIKQKSLFDHLMDDSDILRRIAAEVDNYTAPAQRVPKTYVISRKTLQNLDHVAQGYGVPRDMLVEISIERIFPLLLQEKEKHEKRKEILLRMEKLLHTGEETLSLVQEGLDEDDPVCRKAEQMLRSIKSCCDEVKESILRGQRMEDI